MNFLELCQDVVRQGGISGSIANVANQTGEHGRVVNWTNKAYRYILNKHRDWDFLRKSFSFPAILGTADYSPTALSLADFGEWKLDSLRAFRTEIGVADEQLVPGMPDYTAFRNRFGLGVMRLSTGRPQVVTEKPDQALRIWPLPDVPYTIVGEYYRVPAALAVNADIPVFPARFHDAIVFRALMFYAEHEGDGSIFASAQTEFMRIMAQMELNYLPEMKLSGPMA